MESCPQLQKKLMKRTGAKKEMDLNAYGLWRDGEHEPEGDPEGWIDRVADEVEETRPRKVAQKEFCWM